jgi:hypothetical protein
MRVRHMGRRKELVRAKRAVGDSWEIVGGRSARCLV